MEVKFELLSQPVKITITEEADVLKKKRDAVYEKQKYLLPKIDGFRHGYIPQDIAEEKFGVERLYKNVIDDIVLQAMKEHKIISFRDFTFYGDLKDGSSLKIEAIAEKEPEITLPELNEIEIKPIDVIAVSSEEIEQYKIRMLKEKEVNEEVNKEFLEDLDVAVIDYEGILNGEIKPFKGGSAKNFRLTVNLNHKTFIDTFEDQMIGMKKGETKKIETTFPEKYRDASKCNKKAVFTVTLNSIERKVLPEFNDAFAQLKGFKTIDEYKIFIEKQIYDNKIKANLDDKKKDIISELLKKTKFTPIPLDCVKDEIESQWESFLNRIGKSQEEFLKENPNGKENFITNKKDFALEVVKTSFILKAIISKFKITVDKEYIKNYILNISKILNHDESKKQKLLEQLENIENYQIQEQAALNEKAINFLMDSI